MVWTATNGPTAERTDFTVTRREAVLRYIELRPGSDSEHIAEAFGMGLVEADSIVEDLLNSGELDFDDDAD